MTFFDDKRQIDQWHASSSNTLVIALCKFLWKKVLKKTDATLDNAFLVF